MDYGILDFIHLIGSLGIFLYGMKIMSEGLQKVAGDRMKSILSAMTSNRVFGVFTGILITALIQSSSATTLMTVSFVNASLLTLAQGVSVIMGANIGTTATAWIISLLGFKVNVSAFAIPLIAVAIPFIFSKKARMNSWGDFMLGFSLLFLGLQFLKESMPDLQNNPEALSFLQTYTNLGFGSVLIFLLIGTILTFIVQSSSATVAITLVMCSQGWIPFEMGAAMILGENIGTTITANLAALSANYNAKRAALSHTLFNVFGVVWVLFLFFPAINLVSGIVERIDGYDPRNLFPMIADLNARFQPGDVAMITGKDPIFDPELSRMQATIRNSAGAISIGLSLFHTLFNISNTLVMIWFVPVIVKICNKVIHPSKKAAEKKEYSHLQYLSTRMLSTSELSLLQVNKEIVSFADKGLGMLRMVRELSNIQERDQFELVFTRIDKYERICDRVEIEIVQYLTELSRGDLSGESRHKVQKYLRIASEIESIGDSCFEIARILRRKLDDGIKENPIIAAHLAVLHEMLENILNHMKGVLEDNEDNAQDMLLISQDLEKALNIKYKFLVTENLKDLQANAYPYQDSVYYLDIIDEYERLGDYAVNVVEAFIGEEK
ncbi:Na/Pi cotransporter family protein [Porphyromonas levii]|uniref:Na/Pi cotransporter family protein n=1 Tax=Porphyromonas levii TaxID=28114 RepID=UPI0003672665|nr:Na/Pi cotransporter family protein [Porphyromonas levii]